MDANMTRGGLKMFNTTGQFDWAMRTQIFG